MGWQGDLNKEDQRSDSSEIFWNIVIAFKLINCMRTRHSDTVQCVGSSLIPATVMFFFQPDNKKQYCQRSDNGRHEVEMVLHVQIQHGRENRVYLRYSSSVLPWSIQVDNNNNTLSWRNQHSHHCFHTGQSKFTSRQLPREQICFT